MIKKFLLLFSHQLTQDQIDDAHKNFGIQKIISLPEDLQKKWSNFDPNSDTLDLTPFKKFVNENGDIDDVILIQGDFGATYEMVNFAKKRGLIAVYATTKREAIEEKKEGKTLKKSVFEHKRFREYGV